MVMARPDAHALAHGEILERRIAEVVRAAGGWIGFDAWMTRALYEPGLGYYSGERSPFGEQGDFVTAPELSPLFAECIAVQVSQWFEQVAPMVIEFGAGTGRLAAGVLAGLQARGTPACRYAIIELSAGLRARQRETIARLAPEALPAVEWWDALPTELEGVVLGNEVLDAMPVRLFEHEAGGLAEIGVTVGADGRAAFAPRPADATLTEAVYASLAAAVGGPGPPDLRAIFGELPYRSEIGLQAQAWIRTVGGALRRGAVLLVDYGFPAREYYHPQRRSGTLVAHRRHRVHHDLLEGPGLQDLTAHVDFSALDREARRCGLQRLGYASQARFLINCGILEMALEQARALQGSAGRGAVAHAQALGAVQRLLSEAEMGELFKAIAFGRGLSGPALGFVQGDRGEAL